MLFFKSKAVIILQQVDLKPLLHVETFSWNLCATTLRNKFQQALHIKGRNLFGDVETGLKMLFFRFVIGLRSVA